MMATSTEHGDDQAAYRPLWQRKAERRARRGQQHQAPDSGGPTAPTPLVPHGPTCACAACEQKRQAHVARAVRFREARKAGKTTLPRTDPGDGWDVAQHRLAHFIATHVIQRADGHPHTVEMRQPWVHHLDDFSLAVCLRQLEAGWPYYHKLVQLYFFEGRTQEEIAKAEYLDQTTVGRRLRKACRILEKLYVGLVEHIDEPDGAAGIDGDV